MFVQRYPSAGVRRLWQWIGTGAGFDVAAGNTLAPTETLKLRDGGGANVVLNAEAGPSTYSSGGDTWTAVRFAIPAGTSGLYTSSSAAVNASVHQNTVQPLISPPRIPLFDTDMISVETAATSINIRAAALDTQSALLPEGSATAWWDRGSDFVDRMNWATFVDADYTMQFGRWGVGDDPVLVGLINSVAPDTAWHHVALTYDGGQNLAWYFDGKWMGHYEARLGYLRPVLGGMGAYRPLSATSTNSESGTARST